MNTILYRWMGKKEEIDTKQLPEIPPLPEIIWHHPVTINEPQTPHSSTRFLYTYSRELSFYLLKTVLWVKTHLLQCCRLS